VILDDILLSLIAELDTPLGVIVDCIILTSSFSTKLLIPVSSF